jgi:hypothetical protein
MMPRPIWWLATRLYTRKKFVDRNRNTIPGATVTLWNVSGWNNVAPFSMAGNPTTAQSADPAGGYAFNLVPYGQYNVTASIMDASSNVHMYFARVVLDNSTNCYYVVIPDYVYFPPPLSTVSMYYEKVSLPESVVGFQLQLIRGGELNTTCSVRYTTKNGTALRDRDFPWVTGTVTFGPSETVKVIHVAMTDDWYKEPAQFFYVNLTAQVGASIGKASTICEIRASDPLGSPEA